MDSWGQVELFRMQYGELPKNNDERRIEYAKAFRAARKQVEAGKVDTANTGTMLGIAATICETVNFNRQFCEEISERACFLCKSPATVRGTMEDKTDKFEVRWCDQCCRKIFKETD